MDGWWWSPLLLASPPSSSPPPPLPPPPTTHPPPPGDEEKRGGGGWIVISCGAFEYLGNHFQPQVSACPFGCAFLAALTTTFKRPESSGSWSVAGGGRRLTLVRNFSFHDFPQKKMHSVRKATRHLPHQRTPPYWDWVGLPCGSAHRHPPRPPFAVPLRLHPPMSPFSTHRH